MLNTALVVTSQCHSARGNEHADDQLTPVVTGYGSSETAR